MNTMKIRSIAPWFGGKRTLAPRVVELLGEHDSYFEPFCGSMAVLLAKPKSAHETVNDLHGDLINLAFVLQDSAGSVHLYERSQRTLVCETLLDHAGEQLLQPVDFSAPWEQRVERAYYYFLASWMMRNGVAGTERQDYQIAVRWTPGGGSPTVRWRSATDSIPSWHERLQNVLILNRDAFQIIDSIPDSPEIAVYLDPPYMKSTRGLCAHGSGSGRYVHEFKNGNGGNLFEASSLDDHSRLARSLSRFESARIVVSYYDCDRVRELYQGWTFHDQTMMKNLHQQNGRGTRKQMAPEVLITRG